MESYPGLVWLILVGYLVLAQAALYWAWRLAEKERGDPSPEEDDGGKDGLRQPLLGGKGDEEAGEPGGACVWVGWVGDDLIGVSVF